MEPKKNPKFELDRQRPLFLTLALVISLLLVTVAFEWRGEFDGIELKPRKDPYEEEPFIYRTTIEPPKPSPKPKPVEPVEKPKQAHRVAEAEKEVMEIIKLTNPIDINTDDWPIDEPPIENPDKIFEGVVESMPEFPGGWTNFYQTVSKEMNYPRQARKMRVQGKVFVAFVIEPDGSLSHIRTVKGIGAGCDLEAERVMSLLPKFIPGKQRGRPVRVKMILPITFRLTY